MVNKFIQYKQNKTINSHIESLNCKKTTTYSEYQKNKSLIIQQRWQLIRVQTHIRELLHRLLLMIYFRYLKYKNSYTTSLSNCHFHKIKNGVSNNMGVRVMVFNATFNNISVITVAISFLGGENLRLVASHSIT